VSDTNMLGNGYAQHPTKNDPDPAIMSQQEFSLFLHDNPMRPALVRHDAALRSEVQRLTADLNKFAEFGNARPVAFLSTDIPVLHRMCREVAAMQSKEKADA